MSRRRRKRLKLERSGPWIAIVGLVMVLWCTVSTGLFAPWWGVALAFSLLIPQVVLVAKWARPKPQRTMVVPVVGLAAWAGLAWIGATWWGWSP